MTYEQAMSFLSRPFVMDREYKTDMTRKILELLDNPQDKIKCIHVAGTNGKGSISAMTAKILELSGYKTGIYTSPHIIDFEERIKVNSNYISKEDVARIVKKISVIVESLLKEGYDEPTEFELITCLAFYYFCEQKVDYAVIEVGLGGLSDSTNVITPILSVITSISLDHMSVLGNTLTEIAYEKAGIIKKNVPVVVYNQSKEVLHVIEKVCAEKNSKLTIAKSTITEFNQNQIKEKFGIDSLINSPKQFFNITTKKDSYDVALNLLGVHQMKNTDVVINIVENLIEQGLNIHKETVLQALDSVTWIGRLEIMQRNPMIVLDGAHNIDGVTNLYESIKKYFTYRKLILITGILKDKQVDEMSKLLSDISDQIILVDVDNTRRTPKAELAEIFSKYNSNVTVKDDNKDALETALSSAEKDDLILICGSLYLIGDYRRICMTYL